MSLIPSPQTTEHWKNLLELFVLLLAVPFLLTELFRDPGRLSERMAGHHSLR